MTTVTTYREWTIGLTAESVEIWEQRAERFKALGHTVVQSTLEMAHILTSAKEDLPHGNFQSWCVESLGMSKQQVSNTLKAAQTLLNVSDPEVFSGCSLRTLAVMSSADSEQLDAAMEIQGMLGKLTEQRARQVVQSDGEADIDVENLWFLTKKLSEREENVLGLDDACSYIDAALEFRNSPKGQRWYSDCGTEIAESVLDHFKNAPVFRAREIERHLVKATRLAIRGLITLDEYDLAFSRWRESMGEVLVDDWYCRWFDGEPVESSCPVNF